MGTTKPGKLAAEKLRRAAHHIDAGAGLSAADRLDRLREAVRETEEARELLQEEIIAAEDEARNGHESGSGDGHGEEDES